MSDFLFDQWRSRSPHYDETHEAVANSVRAFVSREIIPHVDEWEEAGELPRELHKKAAEAGLLGLGYPQKYGGADGLATIRATATVSISSIRWSSRRNCVARARAASALR